MALNFKKTKRANFHICPIQPPGKLAEKLLS
jgi:hypothetical protein